MRLFFCFVVALNLIGCGASIPFVQLGTKALYQTKEDLVGSSREELISCLGVPDNRIEIDEVEYWEYEFTYKNTELQCKTTFRFVNSEVKEITFSDFDNATDSRKYSHRVCFPVAEQCGKSQ